MSSDHRNVDMKDMQHVPLTYFKINQIKTKPIKIHVFSKVDYCVNRRLVFQWVLI